MRYKGKRGENIWDFKSYNQIWSQESSLCLVLCTGPCRHSLRCGTVGKSVYKGMGEKVNLEDSDPVTPLRHPRGDIKQVTEYMDGTQCWGDISVRN